MTSERAEGVPRTRGRLSLLLLLAIFAAPVVLAWIVLYVFPDWRPSGTMNEGQLVEPVRPLPAFRVPLLGDETIDQTWLRGKWTLIYLLQGPCGDGCVEKLYHVRQVRLAQGKNIDRLQRLLLWDSAGVARERQNDLQAHFPGQAIAVFQGDTPAELVEVFTLDGRDPWQDDRVYLVDPLGNLMMSYPPDTAPKGMIKDLERLLKYSGLG
jgi:hypothetical protein